MELDAIPVFVKVAQLGSFTQASKALNMPNTTVSAKVAQLERSLGVTLIQRTTRKLHLTDAGRGYLDRCVRALSELQQAESELQTSATELQGTLRITAPVDVGQSILAVMVDRYLKLHPKMEVDLIVTNRMVDLVGEGVDLAIRAGQLKDSSMIAKRFIDVSLSLWASKAYLKKAGSPKDFKDLSHHRFIHFKPLRNAAIEFSNGKQTHALSMNSGPVHVDDFGAVKALAELGLGVGMFPSYLLETDVRTSNLVRLFPDWAAKSTNFAIVYPAQAFVTPKVRAFISIADEFFKSC